MMYIQNTHLRVWLLNPMSHEEPKYLGSTGVFRVMFENVRARVILKEISSYHYGLKDDFEDGVQIVVKHAEVGRPDDWDNGEIYFVFTNCILRRSWIPHLVPTQSSDSGHVTYWVEIESWDWTWNELPE